MNIEYGLYIIHNETVFAEAIRVELIRLLKRPLTSEESNLIADTTFSQTFECSENDAHRLRLSVTSDEAINYLAHANRVVNQNKAELIDMIARALPAALRDSVRAEDYPNLIEWQKALIKHYQH
jgi:hypothetical protein